MVVPLKGDDRKQKERNSMNKDDNYDVFGYMGETSDCDFRLADNDNDYNKELNVLIWLETNVLI